MSRAQLEQQITQEIQDAIGEIMDKYGMRVEIIRDYLYGYDDNEQVEVNVWSLVTNTIEISQDNIFEGLLPKDYGKVKE